MWFLSIVQHGGFCGYLTEGWKPEEWGPSPACQRNHVWSFLECNPIQLAYAALKLQPPSHFRCVLDQVTMPFSPAVIQTSLTQEFNSRLRSTANGTLKNLHLEIWEWQLTQSDNSNKKERLAWGWGLRGDQFKNTLLHLKMAFSDASWAVVFLLKLISPEGILVAKTDIFSYIPWLRTNQNTNKK